MHSSSTGCASRWKRIRDFAVVGCAVKVENAELFQQEVDAWYERLALDAVLVEFLWMPVAGRDEHGAVVHERFYEAAQDHGVCYVCALELVEAEDAGAFCNCGCDEGNGVNVIAMLHFDFVYLFVHVLHEVVEVYPGLRMDVLWQGVIEEIHEHGLAAANIAIHV